MKSTRQQYGSLIINIITAIAIIVSALIWKNTQYENVWLYILCVGMVINALFELYDKRKGR